MGGQIKANTEARSSEANGVASTPQADVGAAAKRVNAALIRAFDLFVALTLGAVLLPLIAVAAAAVRLDSPGPVFYRARRAGYLGRELLMLKFRKMRVGAAGPNLTTSDDDRFTRIGGLYARLKIDEIPQLWHVLKGEMSLVGPRPETFDFVGLHADSYGRLLSVRPGITGLSQIAFTEEARILDHDEPIDDYVNRILPQKLNLDLMYVGHRSLWLNVRILFWTFATVALRRPVAVHRGSLQMNIRRR